MLDLLAFMTNNASWKLHSLLVKFILRLHGIRVGSNFYIEGVPRLKIRGKADNIRIGDNVSIWGNIDIRNRKNGRIEIGDYVNIDNDCRLVVANEALLSIGDNTALGCFSVINCGEDITIGSDCLISGMTYIQSSDHEIEADRLIREQNYLHSPITIGNDVWIGANVIITRGARIDDGCVIGAKSLVRKGHYQKNSICVGIPAKVIRKRGVA